MSGFGRSRFADELNAVLENISMTPSEVVAALVDQGFPLPEHTFNYWLQGYFLPRFDSAFQLVSVLESLCDVSDHRLSDALLQDLSSGASFVPGDLASDSFVPTVPKTLGDRDSRFALLDGTVDWDADLVRKVMRDEVWVNSDFTHFRYRFTVLARVPSVPNPSLTVSVSYHEGYSPGGNEYIYDIEGAILGKQEIRKEDGVHVFGAQLYLPDTAVPGELHQISYARDAVSTQPHYEIAQRSFPWPLELYSCTITFEGEVPSHLEYVIQETSGEERVASPNEVFITQHDNQVRMVAKNFGNFIGYVRCLIEKS